jgi:hypothetical protein
MFRTDVEISFFKKKMDKGVDSVKQHCLSSQNGQYSFEHFKVNMKTQINNHLKYKR